MKVLPNSSKTEIIGTNDGILKIKLNAPPDKGKANRELVELFSETFKVKRKAVIIVKGDKSRNKSIMIDGITKKNFINILGGTI
ncbi:MAG: DUF167 domain-containing protein [bacterium]